MSKSVFAATRNKIYKYRWAATLHVDRLVGGIPSNEKMAEGWIKKNLGIENPKLLRDIVAKTMAEIAADSEEVTDAETLIEMAVESVAQQENPGTNVFKRNGQGLYFEGRNVKAAIKESANIRWPKERWGPSKKGTHGFFAEHVFVVEEAIPLGVKEPSGVQQRIVKTWRGSSISHEEYVEEVDLDFTVISDFDFKEETWAELWVTGENQGIGATRSQGYGRYSVTKWDRVK